MRTAKTLQLLDANNNNISPAVCIDSLYFEQTSGETTYRMSLKNRMIVAGETITVNNNISGTSLENITIPSFNISRVSGSGNDVSVYQINCTNFPIGKDISVAMFNVLNTTFYNRTQTDSQFLRLDGTNSIESYFYVGSDDSSMRLSTTGLSWNGQSEYITVDSDGNIRMNAGGDIGIRSNDIQLYSSTQAFIHIEDASITTSCANASLSSTELYVNATDNINVATGNTITMTAPSGITLTSTTGDINLYPQGSGTIRLYNKSIGNPTTDTSGETIKFLNYQTSGDGNFSWDPMPKLKLYTETVYTLGTFDTVYKEYMDDMEDCSVCFKNIQCYNPAAGEFDMNPPVYFNDEKDTPIKFKGIVSGTSSQTLNVGEYDSNSIYLATINGNSIIGSTDDDDLHFDLLTAADVSMYYTLSLGTATESGRYHLWGSNDTQTNYIMNTHSGSVGYLDSVYFTTGGAMYATSFYASSDERLKTGIKTAEAIKFPEIKEFVWKDTSTKSAGFIAQELEEAGYDYLVSEDESGYKKVNYDAALSLKVASLENENKELRARLDTLEALISKL